MSSMKDMSIIRTFFAGAFLGAGIAGSLTHAHWAEPVRNFMVVNPVITGAAVIEILFAVISGFGAVLVVQRQNRHHAN